MSKTRFFVAPLVALIIIGLLILGGLAIHRAGWSEGYRMGQLAAGGVDGAVMPYAPYGFGYPGLFLTLGLLLLLIVIGKFLRFWAWGPWMMAGGPRGERWSRRFPRHWHRPDGPIPPCWRDWEEPSEEEAEKAKPNTEADTARTEV